MSIAKRIFIFLALVFPLHLQAQDLGTLIRRFVKLNPSLSASAAQERASLLEVQLAQSRVFPKIYLSAQAIDSRSPLSAFGIPELSGFADRELYTAHINLEQPLYLGGRVRNGYQMRKLNYKEAQWRHRANRQKEISRFISSVIHFLNLDQQIAIVKKSQQIQKRFFKLTRNRYKKGIAKLYEWQQAEAESLSFTPRIEKLEQERQTLLKRIEIQLDMKKVDIRWPNKPKGNKKGNNWAGNKNKEERELSLEMTPSLLYSARQQRPDYQQALIGVEKAKTQKNFDLGQYSPTLSLVASWGSKSQIWSQLGQGETEDRSLVLNLNIPLFSGFSSVYTRRARQKSVEAAEKRQHHLEQNLELELQQELFNYKSSFNQLQQTQQWHHKAQQALQSVEQDFRLGIVGSFQVYQLQGASERASLSFVQAQTDVRVARLKYHLTLGTDLYQEYGGKELSPGTN